MKNVFFISDTHFGHEKTCSVFKRDDGSPLRPFSCAEEMDETLVKNWNAIVRPQDKVYHLGDVVINKHNLPILNRLNGHKSLVLGNHDIFDIEMYLPYFSSIGGIKMFPALGLVCTHIPVHPMQLEYRFKKNVHGHMHAHSIPDDRYVNVSVEMIGYTPVALEEIIK